MLYCVVTGFQFEFIDTQSDVNCGRNGQSSDLSFPLSPKAENVVTIVTEFRADLQDCRFYADFCRFKKNPDDFDRLKDI